MRACVSFWTKQAGWLEWLEANFMTSPQGCWLLNTPGGCVRLGGLVGGGGIGKESVGSWISLFCYLGLCAGTLLRRLLGNECGRSV